MRRIRVLRLLQLDVGHAAHGHEALVLAAGATGGRHVRVGALPLHMPEWVHLLSAGGSGWHVHARRGMGGKARVAEDCGRGLGGRVLGAHVVHFVAGVVLVVAAFFMGEATAAGQVVGGGVVVPALERDAARVEALVCHGDDFLLSAFADDDARVAPGEVVLVPEGVHWQQEGVHGEGDDVNDHPAHVLPLPFDDEDDGLETVYDC